MKKLLWALFPVIGILFSSCGAEEDVANPNTVTDIVTTGKWKVNTYIESNQDHTSDFAGYTLSFSRNGTVTAVKGVETYTGSWSEDKILHRITFNFSNPTPELDRINNQWGVADVRAALVNLSDSDTGAEFLGIVQE